MYTNCHLQTLMALMLIQLRINLSPTVQLTWCAVLGSPMITVCSIMAFPLHYWTTFENLGVPRCKQRLVCVLLFSFSFQSSSVFKLLYFLCHSPSAVMSFT